MNIMSLPPIADLQYLVTEAGFHHRPEMDQYLVRTIMYVLQRVLWEARQ